MPTKIAISGATGRMGQTLVRLLGADGSFELIGGIDRERVDSSNARGYGFPIIETAQNARDVVQRADVVIDFSAVAGLQSVLTHLSADLIGKALIVGTTGLTSEVQQQLTEASKNAAVLVSANFSVGVNLMLGLVSAAARVLSAERYDVEIVEAHHRMKVDAPSGTALAIGRAVADARGIALESVRRDARSGHTGERPRGEIGFHALRGGDVIGEHRVHFIGSRERIEIAHAAQDRGLFAEGALVAAKWIVGKPAGSYTMTQVLGL